VVGLFRKVLGNANERALKPLRERVELVNSHAGRIEAMSDDELRGLTDEFRSRFEGGETLDELLPEAFAVAREAVRRLTGERAYDVQVMGAVALHQGAIAEMTTGEGKTLVSTLALYLNALDGEGAHVITVNDYLAARDAQWYAPALHRLGLAVGVLQHDQAYIFSDEQVSEQRGMEHLIAVSRREAYDADITYGTNNEFGFDYLRDNMTQTPEQRVQRARHYAIVDEADSVLIDEARTPLIISGASEQDTAIYPRFARLVPQLRRDIDFTIDERTRSVHLTEAGIGVLEDGLGIPNIFSPENFQLTRYMEAALKAEIIYQRDRDYVVKDGGIVIVDDFTGRLMEGRRWSDGLHQAVEAKEGVQIQQESVTYATITLQNFFRMYDKLSGMTGTAVTEAEELSEIYELEVLVIPTNVEIARDDLPDFVYRSQQPKFAAVIDDIVEKHEAGRPVLVGTVAIETSELLSELLRRRGVEHEVLNAKQHAREATIVARAGQADAVTIATNMAGRGTDIKLGEGVAAHGGLHVIGTERHESRRIDNQLRGRSGRQGDPGSTRFFVSFEDDLIKRFVPDMLPALLDRFGMEDDVPLESKMVTRAIETAQGKVEAYNFDIRKHVVEYDDVMNTHRDMIYTERDRVLTGDDMRDTVQTMVEEEIDSLAATHLGDSDIDAEAYVRAVEAIIPANGELVVEDLERMGSDAAADVAIKLAEQRYVEMESAMGEETQRTLERYVLLSTIDALWVQHLTAMDDMRQGIGLRAYAQTDPLVAYKREAHDMWDQLLENIRDVVARQIYHIRLASAPRSRPQIAPANLRESGPGEDSTGGGVGAGDGAGAVAAAPSGAPAATATSQRTVKKVGRNETCPCGSGKKYKRCHGRAA
jgi:preprotein translocase subunit SecA